jgi:hypothetical protein
MTQPESPPPRPQWWCNFCEFGTDDREAYLAHSCRDVLAAKGKDIPGFGTGMNCR